MIGDSLHKLYLHTKDEKILKLCEDICDFCIKGLNKTFNDGKSICFSYTPLDDYQVHNTNLFIGEFLTRIGKIINNKKFYEIGLKCGNFSLREQQSEGFLPYWGLEQTDKYSDGNIHVDHYHSGYEIRAFMGCG